MAIPRRRALKTLQCLIPRVEEHLAKIASNPGHSSLAHWRHEARNWIEQMEGQLPHVGKKTAAEWQARIQSYRRALEGQAAGSDDA